MGSTPASLKRNITLVGHHGCGKTHLIDAALFNKGLIDRNGIFVMDNEAVEKERKASFSNNVTGLVHNKVKINFVDTPGMPDFHAEILNGIYASENMLIVINAAAGIEIQTERFGVYAKDLDKGAIFFINALDKERASYESYIEELRDIVDRNPVLLQIPIGLEGNFKGVIDLVSKKAYVYDDNGKYKIEEIPTEFSEKVEEARSKMIEDIVETDEELMERYFEGEEISDEELTKTLKKAFSENTIAPIFLGSAAKNIGVDQLLDGIVKLSKDPSQGNPWKGKLLSGGDIEVKPTVEEPLTGYIFKNVVDPFVGRITYIKIISGTLKQGESFVVVEEDSLEKAGHIFMTEGIKDIEVEEVSSGDIIKLTKLKKTSCSDTITHKDRQLILEVLEWPEAMISKSITPKSQKDIDKISTGLARLSESDPTFMWELSPETGETVIKGIGGSHLDIMIERIKNLFSLDVEVGKPKIAYRETIRKTIESEYKHKKQSGGHGQYGHVQIKVEPLPRGEGFEFVDKIVGGVVPKNYIPAVEKGVIDAMKQGVLASYPVVDVRVTLFYGSYHPVDSSDMSFQIAGRQAFKKGSKEASPVILEPIMNVEVFVPDDNTGDVMGDISSRRGRPLGMEPQGKGYTKVMAQVPLAEMLDYSAKINAMTSGRGYFTMKFDSYSETPSDVQAKIISERERELEEKD